MRRTLRIPGFCAREGSSAAMWSRVLARSFGSYSCRLARSSWRNAPAHSPRPANVEALGDFDNCAPIVLESLSSQDVSPSFAAFNSQAAPMSEAGSAAETPAKRRRTRSASSLALGGVKQEPDQPDDEDLLSVKEESGATAAGGPGGGDGDNPCLGCGRDRHTGTCYINAGEVVVWAFPNKRGAWCRDCHCVWRSYYSSVHTLLMFGIWLRDQKHQEEFELCLVAFLSLTVEGNTRVTGGMITDRISMLQWLSRFICIPLKPAVVVPLRLLASEGRQVEGGLKPEALTTMQCCQEGARIGVMLSAKPSVCHGGRVLRPVPQGAAQHLLSRKYLYTNCQSDIDQLTQYFADSTATPSDELAVKHEGTEEPSARKSRLQGRVEMAVVSAKNLLKMFESEAWEGIKESSLTSPLSKASSLHSQACGVADQTCIQLIEPWVHGLTHAKLFLKLYRDYGKANYRHSKLLSVGHSCIALYDFLVKDTDIKPAATLELLWHKVTFFGHIEKHGTIAAGMQTLVSNRLGACFRRLEAAGESKGDLRVSAEAWLRSVLVQALKDAFVVGDSAQTDEATAKLQEDVSKTKLTLAASESVMDRCPGVKEHLDAVDVMLRAVTEPSEIKVKTLEAGMKHLDLPKLKELKDEIYKSAIGKTAVSAAAVLLQASAKDEVGDEKLKHALRCVEDEKLPKMVIPKAGDTMATDVSVQNFVLIRDMTVADSLEEALTYTAESCKLWSKVRREEQVPTMVKWFGQMVGNLQFYDETLCIYIQGLVNKCLPVNTSQDAAAATEESNLIVAEQPGACATKFDTEAWKNIARMLESHDIDESPLLSIAERLEVFVKPMGDLRKAGDFDDFYKVLTERVLPNMRMRREIVAVLRLLAAITTVPASVREAFEEWTAKRTVQEEAKSFLFKAIEVHKKTQAFSGKTLVLDDETFEVRLQLDEGAGLESLVGSQYAAKNLPQYMYELPFVVHASSIVVGAVQQAMEDFGEALGFKALVMPRIGDEPHQPTGALLEICRGDLDRLVDFAALPEMVKTAAKVFAVGARKEALWPVEGLYSLFESLISVVPNDVFTVNLASMCSGNGGAAVWTNKDHCLIMCKIFKGVSLAMTVFAWVRAKYVSEAEGCLRESALKGEITSAMTFVKTTINATLMEIESKTKHAEAAFKQVPWLVNLAQCSAWLSRAKVTITHVRTFFIAKALEGVTAVSGEVQAVTPAYDHVVSDSLWNPSLARKQLLGWPDRGRLGSKSQALFGLIANVSWLHTEWNLHPALEDDDLFKESVSAANAIFTSGRKSLVVIAAASVLLEKTDVEERRAAAHKIMGTKYKLPEALAGELRRL